MFQVRRIHFLRQRKHTFAAAKALLLHRRQAQRLNRHPSRAYQVHVPRKAYRHPRQCGHNVTVQRIQLVQIVDEQEQHFVRQILTASNKILEPIVYVQRIERRVFGQIALRNVADNWYLLAYHTEQLEIIGGPRRSGRKAYDSMHFAVLHPIRDARIDLGDEAALARSVVAVNEERAVSGARPIA